MCLLCLCNRFSGVHAGDHCIEHEVDALAVTVDVGHIGKYSGILDLVVHLMAHRLNDEFIAIDLTNDDFYENLAYKEDVDVYELVMKSFRMKLSAWWAGLSKGLLPVS